jgi:hypothetical protein
MKKVRDAGLLTTWVALFCAVHVFGCGTIQAQSADPAVSQRPPFLGVQSPQPAADGSGVSVKVLPESPAAEAGLKDGDIITEFGGQPVKAAADLTNAIRKHKPGDRVGIKVKRATGTVELTAELGLVPSGNAPEDFKLARLLQRGKYDEMIGIYQKKLEGSPRDIGALYNIACAYSMAKDKDKAMEFLKKAFEAGFAEFDQLDQDPDFNNIRGSAEFDGLVAGELAKRFRVPGFRLKSPADVGLWWCDATYKVMREAPVPDEEKDILINCAKNEYEPFQLIVRSSKNMDDVEITVGDFRQASGTAAISRENVEICLVDYIGSGGKRIGAYPDPLIPLEKPFAVKANGSQPVWFTVYVPADAKAGDYFAEIGISGKAGGQGMPVITVRAQLHVFDFALTKETHTQTAYGINPFSREWHGIKTEEDCRLVYDLYMQNFRKHRVAPYDPMMFYPITEKNGKPDFTEFDKGAARYLDDFGFTAFNFPFPGQIDGAQAFSDEYKKLFTKKFVPKVEHLRKKGWLKKAYCYWIDEPAPDKFGYVKDGLELLKKNCPDLRRLITFCFIDSPNKLFFGLIDLWVPAFYRIEMAQVKPRQKMGEEVWCYVCVLPKAPYPNNFIDYAAIDHRIRFWMLEKYGLDGDLYWSTTYWEFKNPWQDMMTYLNPEKTNKCGRGDGYLLYPPVRERPDKPVLKGPINSLRWELVREGLEDKEYFWLLKQEIKRLKSKGGDAQLIKRGEDALSSACGLIQSLTEFCRDPAELYRARLEIAETIEAMKAR